MFLAYSWGTPSQALYFIDFIGLFPYNTLQSAIGGHFNLEILRKERIRINEQIRVRELRVLDDNGENLGVITYEEAIAKAREKGMDLIEISPNVRPPIAKIADYGKFQYDQKKKQKETKAKAHVTETKTLQVKIGTSENDLSLKAKRTSEWLSEGHRVRINLFLVGRAKYTELDFKKERLDRILNLVSVDYKVAEAAKKSPKGLTIVIERARKSAAKDEKKPADKPKEETPKTS